MELNSVYHGDCLEIMGQIPDKSVDMIFCDLPYGTTRCKWDNIIPLNWNVNGLAINDFLVDQYRHGINCSEAFANFENNKTPGLWQHYKRIIKDNGAIVLTTQTPFDKVLGQSNLDMLRYEWIWEKTQATGHLNAKRMPMKAHENILVFYKKLPTYNPQKTYGHTRKVSTAHHKRNCNTGEVYGKSDRRIDYDSTERYPQRCA